MGAHRSPRRISGSFFGLDAHAKSVCVLPRTKVEVGKASSLIQLLPLMSVNALGGGVLVQSPSSQGAAYACLCSACTGCVHFSLVEFRMTVWSVGLDYNYMLQAFEFGSLVGMSVWAAS